ncbi:MAG: hypothetical protein ACI825_001911 [Planctomycetota bacterium]|jgi:hypothetical protein|uniref:DUF4920 domain-containing protein n=1 Tax=Patiriisocius sp. Uisw_047 TaxID=3230969 RepID=UPI0039E9491E
MKNIFSLIALATFTFSCETTTKKETAETEDQEIAMNYESFGDEITEDKAMTKEAMIEKFSNLKPGDTVPVKFTTGVKEVCASKGCWMLLDMGEDEAMVKFKDYGFFMPKDIAGAAVIVEGLAFVEEMSIDDQRHYAEDAGKKIEEVMGITEPKRTLSVVSNGVLLHRE